MAEEKPVSPGVSMSSAEFEQYQRQFLEERTEKYALLEKVKKLEQEIGKLSAVDKPDKDLDKLLKDKFQKPLQNFLSRAKKDSESDSIHNENESLQKRLLSQEQDFQRQNTLLMQELQQVIARNEELERLLAQSRYAADNVDAFQVETREHTLTNEQSFYQTPSSSFDGKARKEVFEEAAHETSQVEVELIAAREEIRSLHAKLEESTVEKERVVAGLEATMATIVRDLEHKQNTIQTLLTEREDIQRSYTERINALVSEKESVRMSSRTELEKLRAENNEMRNTVEEERVMSRTRIEDVERQMKDLLEQMDVTSRQTQRDTDELLSEHKIQIAALLQQVETLTAEKTALEESVSRNSQVFAALQEENSRHQSSQQELTRLAEKRKATIDDLTAHLEDLRTHHAAELKTKISELNTVIEGKNGELITLAEEAREVVGLTADVTRLRAVTTDLIHEKEHLDAQLEDVKTSLASLQESSERKLTEAKTTIEKLTEELTVIRTSNEQLEALWREEKEVLTSSYTKQIAEREQKILDHAEEIKIVERKHTGVARDLQKQLQSEKKRVEKLQNKLNELLRDGKLRIGQADDSTDFTEKEETGSVSSWSFVSAKSASKRAGPHGDAASISSKTETETGGLAASMTEEEVRDLFIRITKLQQEKASLAERVIMLESGNASMANDLKNKSALIETFLRSTPVLGYQGQSAKDTDLFSLRSVVERLGKDKSVDVDMQKSLRHLLEETLTKNIHLQKNMELLTEELDRLRGSTPPRQ
ncbi:hypothetical protein RvY_13112 [Ramazzottius varieornatus]|uniref:GRIP domain-containing protein n=1 Tax=Ramazzottius varieornatus TaxID=947166 RepID=A0A1D1VLU7_RAMVA|nr:hypothetical protein RvY_13112 [Ramazzottius varieornatus]